MTPDYEKVRQLRAQIRELQAQIAAELRRPGPIDDPRILGIVYKVAVQSGVSATAILGGSRHTAEVRARQRVYWECSEAGFSSVYIARALGRDHTTILHGLRREAERRAQ